MNRFPGRHAVVTGTGSGIGRATARRLAEEGAAVACLDLPGDEKKYGIVDKVVAHYTQLAADGGTIAGQKIRDLVTVNGVRVTLEDGTWGLVRASSNKPELVVVVESPVSEVNMKAIFADIDGQLSQHPEVGAYNQKIVV
jgi:phosphomannomutase/phosphoglucomutase